VIFKETEVGHSHGTPKCAKAAIPYRPKIELGTRMSPLLLKSFQLPLLQFLRRLLRLREALLGKFRQLKRAKTWRSLGFPASTCSQKLVYRQVNIARNFSQKPRRDIAPLMHRNCSCPPVRVPKLYMRTFLPHHGKAQGLQNPDDLLGLEDRDIPHS